MVTDRGRRGAICIGRPHLTRPVLPFLNDMARPGHDAGTVTGNDRSGIAILTTNSRSLAHATRGAGEGKAGDQSRRHAGAGARPVWRPLRGSANRFTAADGGILPRIWRDAWCRGAERTGGQGRPKGYPGLAARS